VSPHINNSHQNQEAVVEKILAGNADVLEPTQEEVSKVHMGETAQRPSCAISQIRHFVQLLLAHATSSEDDIHKCEGNTSFKHGQYTQPAAVDLLNLNGVSEVRVEVVVPVFAQLRFAGRITASKGRDEQSVRANAHSPRVDRV
jgi:hypothetical protein